MTTKGEASDSIHLSGSILLPRSLDFGKASLSAHWIQPTWLGRRVPSVTYESMTPQQRFIHRVKGAATSYSLLGPTVTRSLLLAFDTYGRILQRCILHKSTTKKRTNTNAHQTFPSQ